MFKQFWGWKSLVAGVAILIVAGTLVYVNILTKRLEQEERQKMTTWVEANKEILQAPADANLNLATDIVANNTSIPIIQVDGQGRIVSTNNIDSSKMRRDPDYLKEQLAQFKSQHPPLLQRYNPNDSSEVNYIFYGDSLVLRLLRYYPYVQLSILAFLIVVILIALTITNKATQNQVWIGLAKETAHQLGTPLSSMEAWIELLKEEQTDDQLVQEMGKDLNRLRLISERFSKIGSPPELEEHELVSQVSSVMEYMKRRAPKRIVFSMDTHQEEEIPCMISGLLFDWVIENLIKNALDAMEGQGEIHIDINTFATYTSIDISDTGKGIPKNYLNKVFKPGFSTKKRGWGLGLSLSKRIIESYHKGRLSIRSSEPGKGTTFRIILQK